MICPKCKTKVSSNDTQCPNCNLKLIFKCPRCATPTRLGSASCKKCGYTFVKFCPKCHSANYTSSTICRKCHFEFDSQNQPIITEETPTNAKIAPSEEEQKEQQIQKQEPAKPKEIETKKDESPLLFYVDFINLERIFDKYNNEEFKGCELTAVFGGIECNLENSIIKEDVYLEVTSIFGGIDIKVPKDINVKVTQTAIFGGVSNSKYQNDKNFKYTIYINVNCVFGGVEIK